MAEGTALPELNRIVRVPVAKFGKYEKELTRELTRALFVKSLRDASKEVAQLLQDESIKKGIWYKGKFAKGWRIRKSAENIRGTTATVYNRAPYAIVVERGRRSNRTPPPVRVLIPWVRAKLGLSGSQARSVAFAIARAIGRRGIPGRPIITDPRVMARVQRIIEKAAYRRMRDAMRSVKP